MKIGDFRGGPVVKTLHSRCRVRAQFLVGKLPHAAWFGQKKKVNFVHFFVVENRREARLGMWTQVC